MLVLVLVLVLVGAVLAGAGPASAGSRTWDRATWTSPVIGSSGPLLRFTVRTEMELGYDADGFADEVVEVLEDPRSWAGVTSVRFQLVAGGAAAGLDADAVEMTVLLATPSTVDALCAPLATRGRVSCRTGKRVVVNADRWLHGPGIFHEGFDSQLGLYRSYVVNHEIGHRLGQGHVSGAGCRPDRYAPVMLQQTYGLQGCAPNGWPAYDWRTVGQEPDNPGPPPSGICHPATVFPWSGDDRPLDDAVTRLYRAGLGRDPDPGGLQYWLQRRAAGLTAIGMASEVLASPEGIARHGGADHMTFVTSLYQQALGRAPDGPGLEHWLGVLGSGSLSRQEVLLQFADSAESVRASGTTPPQSAEAGWMSRLYRIVLSRWPDCEGARYWMWSPASRRAITRALIASPELASRYGTLGDSALLDALYGNALGRNPDPGGRAYWLGELQSGRLDRSKLVLTWTTIPELAVRTGTTP